MIRSASLFLALCLVGVSLWSFRDEPVSPYEKQYLESLGAFRAELEGLLLTAEADDEAATAALADARHALKRADFWLRYLSPLSYKLINSPLPVEWETEVFEKFEPPYRRVGGGLFLAEEALADGDRQAFASLVSMALTGLDAYTADSILPKIATPDHFPYANRMFILNLGALYTTGFDGPDGARVIPELRTALLAAGNIARAFNTTWPDHALPPAYLALLDSATAYVALQPGHIDSFDHFVFLSRYVNPLFAANQEYLRASGFRSGSFNDYSLNNGATSIFGKDLFTAQKAGGVFASVRDTAVLHEIRAVGKLLFFDPVLSANNKRSCASCHMPDRLMADGLKYNLHFDGTSLLTRNTPTLVNAGYNHLLHLDGKHISLQTQALGVIANADEMGQSAEAALERVLSCKEYRNAFRKFLKYTPGFEDVTVHHLASALTLFYSEFSGGLSPFDRAVEGLLPVDAQVRHGFNLFMGKAQCATCHFPPQFNGVKPPYIGSEFEVLGVPVDTAFTALSTDAGRYGMLPQPEMASAFRTGSLRNIALTAPYMHNGVFETLEEVVDFYDQGGGAGRGLDVPNQTLPEEPLGLTEQEKRALIVFMQALNEDMAMPIPPQSLPESSDKRLQGRKIGGEY